MASVWLGKRLGLKIRLKLTALKLNRYKILDHFFQQILCVVTHERVSRVFAARWARFLPPLKWVAGRLLLRAKIVNAEYNAGLFDYFQVSRSRYIRYGLADWLLKHRIYGGVTESYFELACEKCREINVNFRYVDFVTQKYGFRSLKLDRVIRRLSSPHVYVHLTKSQRIRLAIMLYQKSKDEQATNIVRSLGRRYMAKQAVSPYLASKMVSHKVYRTTLVTRGSDQYKKILRGRKIFEEKILSSAGSFCIVGNAPTEMGLNKGALIDSKNLVIRLNNYSLDFAEDYGSKQDVWVRVANKEVSNFHARENGLVILAANNFAVKRKDAATYTVPLGMAGCAFTVVPSHIYRDLIIRLGGLPSTGLVIAYWVYKIIGVFPKEALFGFSHLHEIANFKAHYFVDEKQAGVHLHEWEKEIQIFNTIVR